MINNRLFQQYKIDVNKNLKINGYCQRPFDTVLINKNGSCFLCECESWLPASVGNLQIQSLEQILKSNVANQLRQSIIDGNYRYCNNQHCSYLLDDRQKFKFLNKVSPVMIKNIRLAIDDSCNLSCPSCRTKKIFVKDGSEFKKRLKFTKNIIEYVSTQKQKINIHLGSDGDPFASLIYRYFIKNSTGLPNIKYTVQTNGLLLKKMFIKNQNLFQKMDILNVSIDGASPETYESLRRGGQFTTIIDNIKFIGDIKKKYNFALRLHFVVQTKNYTEMPAMIALAEHLQADRLFFNKVTNWGTFENFDQENIHDINHPEHENYKKILQQVRVIIQKKHKDFVHMATIGHKNETI